MDFALPHSNDWRTLLDLFRFLETRNQEAFIDNDGYRSRRSSWVEVRRRAKAFALRLRSAHIRWGDKVILWSENRADWAVVFWGAILEGVVVVPIDVHSSEKFLLQVAERVEPSLILLGEDIPLQSSKWKVWRITEETVSGPEWTPIYEPSPEDIAEIVFTSGSTGEPKGVVITHRNLTANVCAMEREVTRYRLYLRILKPVRLMLLVPFSHLFGQQLGLFVPPLAGVSVILIHSYNPSEIARWICRHRVAAIVAVPKVIEMLNKYVRRELQVRTDTGANWHCRGLQYVRVHRHFGWRLCILISGGAPLDRGQIDSWSQMGFAIAQGYGLTETAPIISFDDPLNSVPGSVGKPLAGTELRFAADGEILVRGANVFSNYFQEKKATISAFDSDGWFRTGDIGKLDRKGHLIVLGRKKEVIVTPEGLKVFPEDVEVVLRGVKGVRDAAIIGTERVHAVLILDENVNAEDIISQANHLLEPHQRIREYSIWPGSTLPRTTSTEKPRRTEIARVVYEAATADVATASQADRLGELLSKPSRALSHERAFDELGLSSLDRVELMMELEEQRDIAIEENPDFGSTTLAKIRALESDPTAYLKFPSWNRRRWAQVLRFLGLNFIVFPLVWLVAWRTVCKCRDFESIRGPILIASNHQSHLDTPLILASLPRTLRYRVAPVMWKEYFQAYFHPREHRLGLRISHTIQYFLACLFFNAFPIPQTERGAWQSIRYCGELLDDGWSILIFPEGQRTEKGEIGALRTLESSYFSRSYRRSFSSTSSNEMDAVTWTRSCVIHKCSIGPGQ